MNIPPKPDHYFNKNYDSKGRFCSYWHQINEIILLKPKEVLEVGIGNGFVSKYLKERGVNVTTLDIDKRLNPDAVGSVLQIPFNDESFELVVCCETLEHLPYKHFSKALCEICRVSKSYVILSLPDLSRVCRFGIYLPKIVKLNILIPLPRLKPLVRGFKGGHYWNIGTAGYPLQQIKKKIRKAGFKLERCYRVFEIPWHRFFLLKKDDD